MLAADLGVVAPEDGVRVHPLLLAANSSWRALAGGVLTLDEARSMAMLVLRLEVAALDDEALSQRLYAFSSAALDWAARLTDESDGAESGQIEPVAVFVPAGFA